MVETGSRRPRVLSPPILPPRWGQDVAPPPTPIHVSPEASSEGRPSGHHRHPHHHRRHRRHHQHRQLPVQQPPEPQHILYEYRFTGNSVERWPFDSHHLVMDRASGLYHHQLQPQPRLIGGGSAESASPPTASSGNSPEAAAGDLRLTNSPVSPTHFDLDDDLENVSTMAVVRRPIVRPVIRPALRQASSLGGSLHRRPKQHKTVQWVSDTKKRAEDISLDRKVVKRQVILKVEDRLNSPCTLV